MKKSEPLYLKPVPIVVAVLSASLGMHFYREVPIHNFTWESLYGIGYLLADLALHPNSRNTIAIIGFFVWPLLMMVAVGFLTSFALRASKRCRVGLIIFFLCSLSIWINQTQANWLCIRRWPVYANYFFLGY